VRPRHLRAALVAHLCLLALATGCASFSPRPLEEVPFLERAVSESRGGLTVATAVPSRKEARQIFGIDLEKKQIQPVWFEIRNDSDIPFAMLLTGVDPNYYSAREAAYKSHFALRPITNARIDAHFAGYQLDGDLPPGARRRGFVFTNLKLGTKEVRARFFGPRRVEDFEFFVAVPGFEADYHEVDWDAIDAAGYTDYADEASFREALRALPCCTMRADGSGEGDPVNLILLGSADAVAAALNRAGWDETEKLTLASAWRTFKAFFGGTYKYSPMSSLYLFGRGQDAGFQKARDTIHERNHLRLWLSPLKYRGESVWVGTITRDIGVYFTTRAWNLTTHAIDPYVDEARAYLIEDFANAQALRRFGYEEGVGEATEEDPHRNLMNAPWWSDGLRAVLEISTTPVPMEQIAFFEWAWGDPLLGPGPSAPAVAAEARAAPPVAAEPPSSQAPPRHRPGPKLPR